MKRTEFTQQWLDALRSGAFRQGRDGFLLKKGRYCCIGVGGELSGCDLTDEGLLNYLKIDSVLGMSEEERHELTQMNDLEEKTFPEIAGEIERMLDDNRDIS